jgi:protein ImuB
LALSRDARDAGIKLGVRRGSVLMLLPEARIYERSAASEEAAMYTVAIALLKYTRLVTLAEESTILIDVGAACVYSGAHKHYASSSEQTYVVWDFQVM